MLSRLVILACAAAPLAACHGSAAAPDASRADAPASPGVTAVFATPPPAYWYVDALPLSVAIAGDGVVAYRYALDGAPFGDEVPIATPLTLTSVAPGRRVLAIEGRDASGAWQAVPTQAALWMATTALEPTACTLKADGGTCDLIVNQKLNYYATSTTFYDANHDGIPDYQTIFDPPPGARICLAAGTMDQIGVTGFQGTPEAPLTFINCGGPVTFEHSLAAAAMWFSGVRYFRIVGIGDAASPYGIVVRTSGTMDANGIEVAEGSSDVEIAHVEVAAAAYAGIVTRSNVTCDYNRSTFAQTNTFLHHNFVHDTGGEGFYMGGSHWNAPEDLAAGKFTCGDFGTGTIDCGGTCAFESELHGVRVYANHTQNTAAEGIQVSSAFGDVDVSDGRVDWDTEVYDNHVESADQQVGAYNSAGLSLQSGTTGRFYRNRVEGTSPTGAYGSMYVMGPGHIAIYDNVILGGTQVGLVIQDNDAGAREGAFAITNNTIVTSGTEGIYMYHQHSVGNQAHDNLVIGAGTPIRLNSTAIDWTASHNLVAGDPAALFVAPAAGDYHLSATSPAVNAGIDTSAWGAPWDFDRTPRTDGAYDIGAYEYHP